MSLQLVVCALCRFQDSSSSSFWSGYGCLCRRMGWGFAPRLFDPTVVVLGRPLPGRGKTRGKPARGAAVSSATQPRARPGPAASPGLPKGAVGAVALSCPGAALPLRGKLPPQPVQAELKALGGGTERLGTPRGVKVQAGSQSPSTPGTPQVSLSARTLLSPMLGCLQQDTLSLHPSCSRGCAGVRMLLLQHPTPLLGSREASVPAPSLLGQGKGSQPWRDRQPTLASHPVGSWSLCVFINFFFSEETGREKNLSLSKITHPS